MHYLMNYLIYHFFQTLNCFTVGSSIRSFDSHLTGFVVGDNESIRYIHKGSGAHSQYETDLSYPLVRFSATNLFCVASCATGVGVWNFCTGMKVSTHKLPPPVRSLDHHPTDQIFVSGTKKVCLLNFSSFDNQ